MIPIILFGVDVPLIELFLVFAFFTAIALGLVVYSLVRLKHVNLKLDQLMHKEEQVVKEEKQDLKLIHEIEEK